MDDNDALTLDQLFNSAKKSPSYWMQVALLEFLQSLAATRAFKGKLSNKEFAKLVGVSPPTLSRWLNGDENLTISTMCRLATALGAAVHIHVADNTKKGRWKEEPGESREAARSTSPHAARLAPRPDLAEALVVFARTGAANDAQETAYFGATAPATRLRLSVVN